MISIPAAADCSMGMTAGGTTWETMGVGTASPSSVDACIGGACILPPDGATRVGAITLGPEITLLTEKSSSLFFRDCIVEVGDGHDTVRTQRQVTTGAIRVKQFLCGQLLYHLFCHLESRLKISILISCKGEN